MPFLPACRAWFSRQDAVLLAALFLAVWYTAAYLGHPALPGNSPDHPDGWLGWWDQAHYLASAKAIARFDLNPDEHLYPLGYPLLGAIFVGSARMHPFYFVDLAALLVTFLAFVEFARHCGVARRWSALLFIAVIVSDKLLFANWVVPWTTSPLAALLWMLLALCAAHVSGGPRRCWLLGLVAVLVATLRPGDLVLTVPPLLVCLLVDLRTRRLTWRDGVMFVIGGLVPGCLYLALHVAIYGLRPSFYMDWSAGIGFTLHGLGWKAYVILVDPRPWIGGGEGLLKRAPWLILGIAGLVPALRRPVPAMLALTLLVHSLMYLAYVDLLPTGFWRYMNVHYWTWAFPGFALLGLKLLGDLLRPATRPLAAGSLAVVVALLCVRLVPVPARGTATVDALDYTLPTPAFDTTYFGDVTLHDDAGTLVNVKQIRAIPMPGGVRVMALKRPFQGDVTANGAGLDGLESVRLRLKRSRHVEDRRRIRWR